MAHPSISNLFPAIAESFAIIFIGYIFGRFRVIAPGDAKGITTLVGHLALPALLFHNLATLDLGSVSWMFLVGVLIAKVTVFVLTSVVTFLLSKKWDFGKAGLYGMFATQSNDFALGLPIVQALYGTGPFEEGQFNYPSYLYLLAPISHLAVNPAGFLMLEYSKQRKHFGKVTLQMIPKVLFKTLVYTFFNPVVLATSLGILASVINTYGIHHGSVHPLPKWLNGFLKLVARAYVPCALFNIGIFMVGKIQNISTMTIIVSSLLVFAKSVLMPMIGYASVSLVVPLEVMNTTRDSLASFGFLYCTFPTAPTLFMYASLYSVAVSTVASSIVIGTLFSAPLIYISARMVLIQLMSGDIYHNITHESRFHVGTISMACLCWVMLLFLLSRRYRSYPHIVIMHLMVAQFVECLGALLLNRVGFSLYWSYFWFSVLFIGVFSARLWTCSLTVVVLLLTARLSRLADLAWYPILISSWGIPMVITVLMVVMDTKYSSRHGPFDLSFLLGREQLIASLCFLITTLLVGIVGVILIVLVGRKGKQYTSLQEQQPLMAGRDNKKKTPMVEEEEEDVGLSVTSFGTIPITGTWGRDSTGKSLTRFIVVILLLLLSCVVGVLFVIWKLVSHSEVTGLYVAAGVLDITINYGQGFLIFLVFGFEKHWFWIVLYERVRSLVFKLETVVLPDINDISSSSRTLCNIFRAQNLQHCKADIVSDKRQYFRLYSNVFTGNDLVSWLIDSGLVYNREEGEQYGNTLLEGRVLLHVSEEHYFHDRGYLYKFNH